MVCFFDLYRKIMQFFFNKKKFGVLKKKIEYNAKKFSLEIVTVTLEMAGYSQC